MNGWTAILPLIGVAVGALLQHWLSRNAEARKQLQLLQSQAYVDYLRSVAKVAHATSVDVRRSALTDAADAKARIAVYGSASVAQALAAFENAGPQLDNPRSIARFLAVVAAMRTHTGEATTDDLETLLLGPKTDRGSSRPPA
jgi:hypothetical protein